MQPPASPSTPCATDSSFPKGATNAAVVASDVYSVVKNLSFGDVQAYLDANVNNKPANNGKPPSSQAPGPSMEREMLITWAWQTAIRYFTK